MKGPDRTTKFIKEYFTCHMTLNQVYPHDPALLLPQNVNTVLTAVFTLTKTLHSYSVPTGKPHGVFFESY
jgi:hypothetical protein